VSRLREEEFEKTDSILYGERRLISNLMSATYIYQNLKLTGKKSKSR
jgi:hypothetical protein